MSEMCCKRCGENEDRINGFCSVECEEYYRLEEEINTLDNVILERGAEIGRLTARVAELEAAQARWVMVSERLPEHGDFVLAWDNEIIEVLEYIRTFGGEWFIDIADAAVYPTHWMPLPQPPEVQE